MAKILKPVSKISGIYGQPGEEKVSTYLATNLSNEYLVLNSPRIFYRGQVVDMDHVVIGPNGLFVVESKNMQGRIQGGLMGNWTQSKTRSGNNEKVVIGNPANQISQYAKILRSYITDNYGSEYAEKILPRVFPVVVFVHDQADLRGIHFTKPGFVGKVRVLNLIGLVDYIRSYEENVYDNQTREQFAHIIVPPEQRDQTGFFNPVILKEGKDHFLARYEIIEQIGQGSFGSVYRGYDFKLEREVAVKKLHGRLKENPEAVKMFFREAQIAAKLQHDNIVAVYDYYEEQGDYFLILEFIEGQPLDKFLSANEISLVEASEIFESICSAVEEAHKQGIVHLDLKPGNILITVDRKVKVTDFGMAQLIESCILGEEVYKGTPAVMAPEQLEGGRVDEKTDIFALGIIAYLLMTGQHPFPGAHVGEMVHKIIHFNPDPPRSLVNQLPEEASELILQMLSKKPDNRLKSVSVIMKAWAEAFSPENLMYATSCSDSFLPGNIACYLRKFIPKPLRRYLKNDKRQFAFVAALTVLIFVGFFMIQSYRDSHPATPGSASAPGTHYYGFNNNNIKDLFQDPQRYRGIPVNLIGGVNKIVSVDTNKIVFLLSLESAGDLPNSKIMVSFKDPHFLINYKQFLLVSGSVSDKPFVIDGESVPNVIADKVQPIEDPWTVLAPSIFNVYVNENQSHGGKDVLLEKVEFASSETRVFIKVSNNTTQNAPFNLSNPRASQGFRIYKQVHEHYGILPDKDFYVEGQKSLRIVLFLEKMDTDRKEATFLFGKNIEGEQPYSFKVEW